MFCCDLIKIRASRGGRDVWINYEQKIFFEIILCVENKIDFILGLLTGRERGSQQIFF